MHLSDIWYKYLIIMFRADVVSKIGDEKSFVGTSAESTKEVSDKRYVYRVC